MNHSVAERGEWFVAVCYVKCIQSFYTVVIKGGGAVDTGLNVALGL